jgi:hypothetical protein
MTSTEKRNADDDVVFPKDHLGNPPIAWIVEPKDRKLKPYLTLKGDVAMKRYRAGDFVTPYLTQHEIETEDEL